MWGLLDAAMKTATGLYHESHQCPPGGNGFIESGRVRTNLRIIQQNSGKEVNALAGDGPIQDCEYLHIANTVARAILNPICIQWDVQQFEERAKFKRVLVDDDIDDDLEMEEDLRKFFGPTDPSYIFEPATIVDIHGIIMVWYLPGILASGRTKSINNAVALLSEILKQSYDSGIKKKGGGPWRTNPKLFQQSQQLLGNVNISPGWFEQAQERLEDNLMASKSFSSPTIAPFLQATLFTETLLNAVVAMTAPDLFHCGVQAITELNKMKLHPNAALWSSIFSGMGVIVNRATPRHRDKGGALPHFDLLCSAGEHTNAELCLPDISAMLKYDPGTAVMITGRALAHSVPKTWKGSRICLAHYIKSEVHARLGVQRPGLVNIGQYDALKDPGYLRRVHGILS